MTDEQKARIQAAGQMAMTGWRWGVREVCWTLGLSDDDGNPSLSRVMCAFFAAAAFHGRLFDEMPVTWEDVAMGFLAVCGYFGLKGLMIFGSWKDRKRASAEISAVTSEREIL